jgi:hypothetical protein
MSYQGFEGLVYVKVELAVEGYLVSRQAHLHLDAKQTPERRYPGDTLPDNGVGRQMHRHQPADRREG